VARQEKDCVKKVLAIAPYSFLPYHSGGQKFIAQFFHHLGSKVNLTVLSVPANDINLATTYQLIHFLKEARSRYYDSSLVKKISALVKEGSYDTVIWEHPYYWWLAKKVRAGTGITSIIHTHNIEYQRFRSMGKWWWPILEHYERRAFKEADGIFFITPEDKQFAIDRWKIEAPKCIDLPFGIDNNSPPGDRDACRKMIQEKHGIGEDERILFFNGLLSYKPNIDAVNAIIKDIDPKLETRAGFSYRILICGKDLPEAQIAALNGRKNIIYAGFTSEIDSYCKASDILLNPVLSGGGIKTKMVEAIGYGTTVISTTTGAIGIYKNACGEKLVIVPDNDWDSFANEIVNNSSKEITTPAAYYQLYNWQNIIDNLLQSTKHLTRQPE